MTARSVLTIAVFWALGVLAVPLPASAATKTLPDACALITKANVTAAFAKLEPALQPTTISDPTSISATKSGGQCQIQLVLPNSVAGKVLAQTSPTTKQAPCPSPSATGTKTKIGKTKALLEPTPSDSKVIRDIVFADGNACALILIQLSGGTAKVPEGGFVDLATAALSKSSGSGASTSTAPSACALVTKTDAAAALGQAVNDNDATSSSSCEYRETSGPNFVNVTVTSGQTGSDLQRMLSSSGALQPLSGLGDTAYLTPLSIGVLKGDVVVRIDWLGGAAPTTSAALKQLAQNAVARL